MYTHKYTVDSQKLDYAFRLAYSGGLPLFCFGTRPSDGPIPSFWLLPCTYVYVLYVCIHLHMYKYVYTYTYLRPARNTCITAIMTRIGNISLNSYICVNEYTYVYVVYIYTHTYAVKAPNISMSCMLGALRNVAMRSKPEERLNLEDASYKPLELSL